MGYAKLLISYGQAFVAPEHGEHRSSMSVRFPAPPLDKAKGGCALISNSIARNAMAKQAGDLSVRGFLADYFSTPDHWEVRTAATRVLVALNSWCHGQSRHLDGGSFVSSLSTMIYRHREAHLFHVGDTLVFRLRGAEFEQLTRDHVNDLGGYRYPSRAMGMDSSIDIDYAQFPLKQGDIFVFTTQAISGTLMPSDYVRLIRMDASDLDAACERLADEARLRAQARGYGGDQFCFQLVRIDELPDAVEDHPGLVYGDLPIPPELGEGDRLDGFDVVKVLSRTSKSRVYHVKDTVSGREAVMKAPSPELSLKNAYLEHFLLQQWVVERVRSPFVVDIIESSRPRHYLYYLMARVEGDTLREWALRHPQATFAQRMELCNQLSKAVKSLHNREVLHQQISPDNVLVDVHGKVVLADFSACHRRESAGGKASSALVHQLGITEHSAPEYALGDSVGRRSDQYSLASTVYWLLTGRSPYVLTPDQLQSHTDLERMIYKSARGLNPEVPPSLDDALRRALSPHRALRFRRLSEFVHALRLPISQRRRQQQADTRRYWQGVAGVLLLLLVLSWLIR